jgi:maltose alpha-D-glucosyltransferase/alpha-amylase
VLTYVRQYGDEAILCVANLSRSAQATEIDLSSWKDRIPLEMLGRSPFPAIGELTYLITLAPYGFYWFHLREKEVSIHVEPTRMPEFETLVVPLGATWVTLERTRGVFERDVLPPYLSRTRWFPERSPSAINAKMTSAIPFANLGDNRPWLAFFEWTQTGTAIRYTIPLRIRWHRFEREYNNPRALAAVRQGAREGTLLDVASEHDFIEILIDNLRRGETVIEGDARLEFRGTDAL